MKKKYNAPLAEVLELEIDETICAAGESSGEGETEDNAEAIL